MRITEVKTNVLPPDFKEWGRFLLATRSAWYDVTEDRLKDPNFALDYEPHPKVYSTLNAYPLHRETVIRYRCYFSFILMNVYRELLTESIDRIKNVNSYRLAEPGSFKNLLGWLDGILKEMPSIPDK